MPFSAGGLSWVNRVDLTAWADSVRAEGYLIDGHA